MQVDTPRQPKPGHRPPDGYAWAVVDDTGPLEWLLATDAQADRYHCRYSTRQPCSSRVVASLQRGRSRGRHFYCAGHMYGRWIESGRIVSWRLRRIPS